MRLWQFRAEIVQGEFISPSHAEGYQIGGDEDEARRRIADGIREDGWEPGDITLTECPIQPL